MYQGADGETAFHVWGAQVEVNASFPSSYIPTTGSAVTRAADAPSIMLARLPFSDAQGSVFVEAQWGGATETCVALNDGTNANRVLIRSSAGSAANLLVTSGGSGVANIAGPNIAARPVSRIAAAWRADDFAVSFNGAAVATDNGGAAPSGLQSIQIGAQLTGEQMFGHVRRVLLLPRRITNAELQALAS